MSCTKVAAVAVEKSTLSFDMLFSYQIPYILEDIIKPGMRVIVPFGKGGGKRQGFVFGVSDAAEYSGDITALKEIYSVVDAQPLLNGELTELAKWLSERTFSTLFAAAKALLPGGMCLRTEKTYCVASEIPPDLSASLTPDEKTLIAYLSKRGKAVKESGILKKLGLPADSCLLKKMCQKGLLTEDYAVPDGIRDLSVSLVRIAPQSDFLNACFTTKQSSVMEFLGDAGAADIKEICYYTGVSQGVVRTLIEKGFCETFERIVPRAPQIGGEIKKTEKHTLSASQRAAFETLFEAYGSSGAKKTALLYGVTGSGKTSVYLELIDKVLLDKKSVIVLVPEISLTPQVFSIFENRYGKQTAVLHSALSAGERCDEWKRIRSGKASVIVGTRSAVFAPVDNIGMIIIDEEQEHTYKSEMSPRYNAKEVAKFRCAYHGALLLFSSATPSVETYARALQGQYLLCELNERYGGATLPQVLTVDMTDKSCLEACFSISRPLAAEIENNLSEKKQTILLVNRRGYNTFVACSDCKRVISCPHCSISLTYHSANHRLMCHYCGYSVPFTDKCPHCGGHNIRYSGTGTQRVQQELEIRFPSARVLRMDADTTTTKNSHQTLLNAFSDGEYDILLGTQMVAKGLDFPNVTLVGVISADRELYSDDFRGAERSFSLITQVVGRAGRGKDSGKAVIQTIAPDNNIIDIAARQDYKQFFKNEISIRRAMIYPPYCDLCVIGFSGTVEQSVEECASAFFSKLKSLNTEKYPDLKLIVLGPLAPKVLKLNNTYRQRIIIKCKNTKNFRSFIRELLCFADNDKAYRNINLYVDMNPENMN